MDAYHYYMGGFVWERLYVKNQAEDIFSFFLQIVFFILSIFVIYRTFRVKQLSWMYNITSAFGILVTHIGSFFFIVFYIVFLSNYADITYWFELPSFVHYCIANIIILFAIIAILILLFKPDVRHYFKQDKWEE